MRKILEILVITNFVLTTQISGEELKLYNTKYDFVTQERIEIYVSLYGNGDNSGSDPENSMSFCEAADFWSNITNQNLHLLTLIVIEAGNYYMSPTGPYFSTDYQVPLWIKSESELPVSVTLETEMSLFSSTYFIAENVFLYTEPISMRGGLFGAVNSSVSKFSSNGREQWLFEGQGTIAGLNSIFTCTPLDLGIAMLEDNSLLWFKNCRLKGWIYCLLNVDNGFGNGSTVLENCSLQAGVIEGLTEDSILICSDGPVSLKDVMLYGGKSRRDIGVMAFASLFIRENVTCSNLTTCFVDLGTGLPE